MFFRVEQVFKWEEKNSMFFWNIVHQWTIHNKTQNIC